MDIQQKLKFSQQTNQISFIKDSGLFCGLYNQSAYIVTELLHYDLKLRAKAIKKMNHQVVISCGIPITSVTKRFPNAVETEWGFQILGEFDLSYYSQWRENIISKFILR